MPFSPFSPSSQLGVLKGWLDAQPDRPYSVDTAHLFVHLAREVGLPAWETLTNTTHGTQVGNLLFQRHLLGEAGRSAAELLGVRWLSGIEAAEGLTVATIDAWQDAVDRFLEGLTEGRFFDTGAYDVIGLSTVFNQLFPSLALARRLTEATGCRVVLGGVEVHGECGERVLDAFSFVDYVVEGRGERPLDALLRALAAGGDGAGIPGVRARGGASVAAAADDTPSFGTPDYDEWFETLDVVGIPREATAGVPVEASQGCHWRRCDFCGTREVFPHYRVKPAAAIREEVRRAVTRYGVFHLVFTDEAVPVKRLARALEGLSDEPFAQHIAFLAQLRATLSKSQLEALVASGLRVAQVGIESFSSAVLTAMDKGATALENVRCLKWCRELGVPVDYNVILGYPDTSSEELARQAELFPRLWHLDPPQVSDFYLNRFSRRFCAEHAAGRFVPSPLYNADRFPEALGGLAWIANEPVRKEAVGEDAFGRALAVWSERHRPGLLQFLHGGDFLQVEDRRTGQRRGFRLAGLARDVHLFLDDVRSLESVRDTFGADAERALALVDDLDRAGLVARDGDDVLALAPRFAGRVDWQ